MRVEHHYRWRHRWINRWIVTSFHCTEEQIRAEHPEAEAVEGSLIVREVPDTEEEAQAQAMRGNGATRVG